MKLTIKQYIYTFVHHPDEHDLCRMEMRAFFGRDTEKNHIISSINIDPSRSPFIQEQLEVWCEGNHLEVIEEAVKKLPIQDSTFKVVCLNKMDLGTTEKIHHFDRRKIERQIGLSLKGEPDLINPELILGLIQIDNHWYFGKYTKSESIWRKHLHKPNSYSTALSTRVARSIVNIAIPQVEGVRAIDPCCGIGTVAVEALSMGIDIVGRDISPLVCFGARENIAHFGYETTITKGPIQEESGHYDVAIVDLPYNIYSHISKEQEFDIIQHARRIADRVLFVSIDPIEESIQKAGFQIIDRSIARKSTFERQILLCE